MTIESSNNEFIPNLGLASSGITSHENVINSEQITNLPGEVGLNEDGDATQSKENVERLLTDGLQELIKETDNFIQAYNLLAPTPPLEAEKPENALKIMKYSGEALENVAELAEKIDIAPELNRVLSHLGEASIEGVELLSCLFAVRKYLTASKESRELSGKIDLIREEIARLKQSPGSESAESNINTIRVLEQKIEELEYKKDKIVGSSARVLFKDTVNAVGIVSDTTSRVIQSFSSSAAPIASTVAQGAGAVVAVAGVAISIHSLKTESREREIIREHGFDDLSSALKEIDDALVIDVVKQRYATFSGMYDKNILSSVKNTEFLASGTMSIGAGLLAVAGFTGVGTIVIGTVATTVSIGAGGAYAAKSIYDNRHNIGHSLDTLSTRGNRLIAGMRHKATISRKESTDKKIGDVVKILESRKAEFQKLRQDCDKAVTGIRDKQETLIDRKTENKSSVDQWKSVSPERERIFDEAKSKIRESVGSIGSKNKELGCIETHIEKLGTRIKQLESGASVLSKHGSSKQEVLEKLKTYKKSFEFLKADIVCDLEIGRLESDKQMIIQYKIDVTTVFSNLSDELYRS